MFIIYGQDLHDIFEKMYRRNALSGSRVVEFAEYRQKCISRNFGWQPAAISHIGKNAKSQKWICVYVAFIQHGAYIAARYFNLAATHHMCVFIYRSLEQCRYR